MRATHDGKMFCHCVREKYDNEICQVTNLEMGRVSWTVQVGHIYPNGREWRKDQRRHESRSYYNWF